MFEIVSKIFLENHFDLFSNYSLFFKLDGPFKKRKANKNDLKMGLN